MACSSTSYTPFCVFGILLAMCFLCLLYSLCGERGEHDQRVFKGLTGSSWISRPLKKWIEASGITKHITFHCSRHTFATLQLENDTDIYTIKGMLGHTNVKTTQIYAHIVDKSKRNAADAIHINNLK